MWSGYLTTKLHVNIASPWRKEDYDRVKAAGLPSLAFCSGLDDPAACKQKAADWGVKLCLDVESGIRGDGPWVQPWLDASGAGLYGNAPVFAHRRAPFYVLAWYLNHNPNATWVSDPRYPRPHGPCGWQWQGTHSEFGCSVDRGWYDPWFTGTPEVGNHWTSLGGTWDGDPVLTQNADGRLELMNIGGNAHLFDLAQVAPNGSWWSQWADLGPPPPGGTPGRPALGRNLDGRLEVFLRGGDGKISHRWQSSAGGGLTPSWVALGTSTFSADPVVASNLDGRLQLFVIGDDGHLHGIAQGAPNGSWEPSWSDFGALPAAGAAGRLVVGRNLDGRLDVFLRGGDGAVYHRTQQGAGGPLTPAWASLGGTLRTGPVVAQNLDGRLELLGLAAGGHLHDLAQTAPDGGWWQHWADLGATPSAEAIAVGRNRDGRLDVFVRGADHELYHRWQQTPGGALTPTWASLNGSFKGTPVVGSNQDGRLEVFIVGTDARLEHDWQVAPNGDWA